MELLVPERNEIIITFNLEELNEFLPEIIIALEKVGFRKKDFRTDTMLRIRQYVFEKVEEKELEEVKLIKKLKKELEECKEEVNLLRDIWKKKL